MDEESSNQSTNEWMGYGLCYGLFQGPGKRSIACLVFFFFFLSLLSLSDRFSGPAWVDWIKYI